jgi:O-antigen/teichoic acid export membrane protein
MTGNTDTKRRSSQGVLGSGDHLTISVNVALRGATALANLVLLVALTVILGPVGLGAFHIFAIAVDYGRQLIGFSYYVFIMREVAGSDEGLWPEMVTNHVHFQLLSTLAWMPIGAAIWLWFDVPMRLAGAFLAIALMDLLGLQFENTLVAIGRSVHGAVVLFARRGLWVAILLAFICLDRIASVEDLYPIWIAGLAASSLLGGWLLIQAGIPIRVLTRIDVARLKRGLSVAARYSLIAGFVLVVQSAAKIVLAFSDGEAAVGELYFFYGILSAAATVGTGGVSMVFIPRLIRANSMGDPHGFRAAFRSMLWGSVLTALGLTGIALGTLPVLLETMDRSELALDPFLILAVTIATIAIALTTVPHSVLYAISLDRLLLRVTALGAGVAVLSALLLIPAGGTGGAAWALAAGNGSLLFGSVAVTTMAWRHGAVPR